MTIRYSQSFLRDDETDTLIDVQIRVDLPDSYDLTEQALDGAADDAVESVLVNIYEVDTRDAD